MLGLKLLVGVCLVVRAVNSALCASGKDTHELVPSKISACAGQFDGGAFGKDATGLCNGTHSTMCTTEKSMAAMGLTKDVCGFGGSNDANLFYISQQGGLGWDCDVQSNDNVMSVFGCGGGTYIHAATACGVLADVGSSGEDIGYPANMGVTDNNDNLHSVFNHANGEKNGVLCCAK